MAFLWGLVEQLLVRQPPVPTQPVAVTAIYFIDTPLRVARDLLPITNQ